LKYFPNPLGKVLLFFITLSLKSLKLVRPFHAVFCVNNKLNKQRFANLCVLDILAVVLISFVIAKAGKCFT